MCLYGFVYSVYRTELQLISLFQDMFIVIGLSLYSHLNQTFSFKSHIDWQWNSGYVFRPVLRLVTWMYMHPSVDFLSKTQT